MRYLAILKDSLVETLDRKSLYFLLAVSVLVILACASFSFRELDAQGALEHIVGDFSHVRSRQNQRRIDESESLKYAVSGFRVLPPADDGSKMTHEFVLTAAPKAEFHKIIKSWSEHVRNDKVEGDPDPELESGFLRSRFRERMIHRVEVEPQPGSADQRAFKVRLGLPAKNVLEGGHELGILFGTWKVHLPLSLGVFISFLQATIAHHIAGFWGLLIAILFTAGFIPNFIQKGTLDLVLTRPVHRPFVLLTKYFGGLLYVAIPATFLVGGCWLVLSMRSGYYDPSFLLCIAFLIATFALLYAVSALFGVLTRSTIASLILTIGTWGVSWLVSVVHSVFRSGDLPFTVPGWLQGLVSGLKWVLPRTSDLDAVSWKVISKGNLGTDFAGQMNADMGVYAPETWIVVLSSVLFVGGVLGLACWLFSRRDY